MIPKKFNREELKSIGHEMEDKIKGLSHYLLSNLFYPLFQLNDHLPQYVKICVCYFNNCCDIHNDRQLKQIIFISLMDLYKIL